MKTEKEIDYILADYERYRSYILSLTDKEFKEFLDCLTIKQANYECFLSNLKIKNGYFKEK